MTALVVVVPARQDPRSQHPSHRCPVYNIQTTPSPLLSLSATLSVQAVDVGDVSSVLLECKGGGLTAAWHLSSVKVTNTSSGQSTQFMYNDWFDSKKGWKQVRRYLSCRSIVSCQLSESC